MFRKKSCKNCGKKLRDNYRFCPDCGTGTQKGEDWGMLGKNDFANPLEELKLPMGLNTIFNSLVKNLDKQFNDLNREMHDGSRREPEKNGISISISASGESPPKINIKQFGRKPKINQKFAQEIKKIPVKNFSSEQIAKLSKFPKEESQTEMKRLSNKIIYEVEMPGVKSLDDVSIINLENSIEIKAISKNKIYFKLIPINLPIIDYNLSKGKLFLELKAG